MGDLMLLTVNCKEVHHIYFMNLEMATVLLFCEIPVAGHGEVCLGFLFHCQHKSTNLTTLWFDWLTMKCMSQLEPFLLVKLGSTCKMTYDFDRSKSSVISKHSAFISDSGKVYDFQTFCDSGKEHSAIVWFWKKNWFSIFQYYC